MKKTIIGLLLSFVGMNAFAQSTLKDEDLRKLFIITGTSAISTDKHYGGVVLFKSFFEIYGNACSFKKFYSKTTIFVDQEGGSVVRIAAANTPSPLQSKGMTQDEFYTKAAMSAQVMKDYCVDANLGPFVEASKYTTRSYSPTPSQVIPAASTFSTAMQSKGVKTVLKHFPAWNENCRAEHQLDALKLTLRPHSEVLTCSLPGSAQEAFEQKAKVFISVPSDAIMIANTVIPELSPYPSTMNPKIREILKNDLGYKKVLISDALWEIQASPSAVLRALKVVDWVMVGEADDAERAIPAIRQAIADGTFTEAEIKDKIALIDAFKEKTNAQ